jgi:serine/threonine protein kinase
VIHRDIKPENIIRREVDNSLVLVDFGAAKVITPQNRSVTGTVIGSAEYIAPEQGNGKAVNASDLYSLGVTCIYLLTGISPFNLFDTGEHEWVWRQYLVNNPISDELGNILDKLIEFGTKRRYQSAEEVLQVMNLQARVTPIVIQPSAIPASSSYNAAPTPSPFPILQSAREIDYTKLRDLLKQQKWRDADAETARIMLQVANRIEEGWLGWDDINKLPCEDLQNINRLWIDSSGGRFGFSVQTQIYRSLGGTEKYSEKIWDSFGDRVGWRQGLPLLKDWIYYKNITFELKAPRGHLPLCGIARRWVRPLDGEWVVGGFNGKDLFSLVSKLVKCKI